MLLIDDEADNASVNTASIGADPTSINERIRALLSLFGCASYIGFTATPFANIFIDKSIRFQIPTQEYQTPSLLVSLTMSTII